MGRIRGLIPMIGVGSFIFGFFFMHSSFAGKHVSPMQLRTTYYYLVNELDYPYEPLDQQILSMNDRVLAQVSTRFKKATDIEGSAVLRDGRVINFDGRKANGEIRYKISPHSYGDGVGLCPLIPFHTVAVDPIWIPLGSVIRVAETVGMILPDGSVHDGLWRAEDIGSAIKKDRIDLFIGGLKNRRFLKQVGIENFNPLTVSLVESPVPGNCTTLH